MNLKLALKSAEAACKIGGKFVVKHLPTILTAVGSVGVIVGTVMAAKKAPAAHEEFQETKDEWESLDDKEKRDKAVYIWKLIKIGGKYYGLVALVVGGSIVCFWMANHINLKRLGIALAGLKASTDYAKDLENQIKKEGGDSKLAEIKDKINADSIQKNQMPIDPSKLNNLIGEFPVWDPIMRQWMVSSADKIRSARSKCIEDLVQQMRDGNPWCFVPYCSFLEYCGWQETCMYGQEDAGRYLGFGLYLPTDLSNSNLYQLAEEAISVDWTAELKDGETPVLALRYDSPLVYDQNRDF